MIDGSYATRLVVALAFVERFLHGEAVSTYQLDDYPNPHPNGIGLTFNYVVWQMLKIGEPCHVNIRKPNNPYRCERGPNPWDYYFHQIAKGGGPSAPPDDGLGLAGNMAWDVRHQRAINMLVADIFHLKSDLYREVESFAAAHFRGKVLGVHLRGTDKASEYQPLSNRGVAELLDPIIAEVKPDTIFLQTDDIEYWKYMQRYSPVSLNMPRGNLSLHHNPPLGPYESGRSAIVDGFLGARCHHYARTPSNFSTISLIMGQHESIHLLNKHCRIDPFPEVVDRVLGL